MNADLPYFDLGEPQIRETPIHEQYPSQDVREWQVNLPPAGQPQNVTIYNTFSESETTITMAQRALFPRAAALRVSSYDHSGLCTQKTECAVSCLYTVFELEAIALRIVILMDGKVVESLFLFRSAFTLKCEMRCAERIIPSTPEIHFKCSDVGTKFTQMAFTLLTLWGSTHDHQTCNEA